MKKPITVAALRRQKKRLDALRAKILDANRDYMLEWDRMEFLRKYAPLRVIREFDR